MTVWVTGNRSTKTRIPSWDTHYSYILPADMYCIIKTWGVCRLLEGIIDLVLCNVASEQDSHSYIPFCIVQQNGWG